MCINIIFDNCLDMIILPMIVNFHAFTIFFVTKKKREKALIKESDRLCMVVELSMYSMGTNSLGFIL